MRFVTVAAANGPRAGVVVNDQVVLAPPGVTMLDLLQSPDGLVAAGTRLLASPETVQSLEGSRLLAPIPQPPTVRDFMTFERHVEGVSMLMGDGGKPVAEWYQFPVFYFANPYAITGPYDDVPLPPGSEVLDFELEVAAVIGTAGRDIAQEDAESHIAGYLIMNDWSARDLQRVEMRAHMGPVKGKDTATTLGPALVSADELAPYRDGSSFDLSMTVAVNDQVIGTDRLSNMTWDFAAMVAYASRGTWVRPGDVLGSGTCGSGCLAELWGRHGRGVHPPLTVGDTVTMEVDVLGTIRNTVVPGSPVRPIAPRLP